MQEIFHKNGTISIIGCKGKSPLADLEFREIIEGDKTIAEMVSLTELSNHYKKK